MDPMQLFMLEAGLLTILGPIVLIAQLGCLVHVIRTGRPYWWLWIIFGFPLVGIAAYLLLEVRPSLPRGNLQTLLWRLKSPQERIRILEFELEESSTVKNRLRLADELHLARQYDRECTVLSEGLRGPFKDDSQLLMRLAQANLEAGRIDEAAEIIARMSPERSADSQMHYSLLKARVLGKQGKHDDAERLFKELIARKRSEGPRYFYAEYLLDNSIRRDEAIALLKDILLRYRRGTPVWRFQERRWYYAAKYLLKSPPAPQANLAYAAGVPAVKTTVDS